MPGEDIQSWNTTASNNSNADTLINWTEGQPRASVNNSARSMMAAHAKDRNLNNGSITTGGTANAYAFTSGVTYTSIPANMRVVLRINATNTGASTLNMDGIADTPIKSSWATDPVPGDLVQDSFAEFIFNGTNWVLLGTSSATGLASTISGKVNRSGDTMTGSLTVNGNFTATGNMTANGLASAHDITTAGNLVSTGGNVYTQAAVGSNATLHLLDSAGGTRGFLLWNAADNSIILQNSSIAQNITFTPQGRVQLGTGLSGRTGQSGGYVANSHNFWWDTIGLQTFVDSTGLGYISVSSDYRIKKDIADLPDMWETVKALRPIKYTQADHAPLFVADNVERWGFIAHELQETLTQSAATGVKDQPDIIQSPNPSTIIAALTKALQEAMTRIEALEARG